MDTPGVTVRPLRQMNGDQHFSEVFLEDVRISDSDRVGAVGGGWRVSVTVLANERTGLKDDAGVAASITDPPEWLTELTASGALRDEVLRDRAMRVYVDECVVRMMQAALGGEHQGRQRAGPRGIRAEAEVGGRVQAAG